jgi:hypothetical protein
MLPASGFKKVAANPAIVDFPDPDVPTNAVTDPGVVKITLPENNTSIFASKYQMYLPTEKQLLDELTKELRKLEL